MKFIFFSHAISSCWNNGNAHFLRGVTRELARLGHDVVVYEPEDGWSRVNAIRDGGESSLAEAAKLMTAIDIRRYRSRTIEIDIALDGADVVIAHEWNDAWLLEQLRTRRTASRSFQLLFHDTHHRAITAPHQIAPDLLDRFDGALVFGEALRDAYLRRSLIEKVFVWHEAADTALFHPMAAVEPSCDLIWIGNWGDDERSAELHELLIEPASRLQLNTRVHGVRYPELAKALLKEYGLAYHGWLPNHRAQQAFSEARVTVHVPRAPYVKALPGIPTIRVFEALACGIPLICSPWDDCENLFPAGSYLGARDGNEMTKLLRDVLSDAELAADLRTKGLEAIERAHTCAHRARELVGIVEALNARVPVPGYVSSGEAVAA